MKSLPIFLSLISFIIFNTFPTVCNAEMYKWRDADGVLHFSDVQPSPKGVFEKIEGYHDDKTKQLQQNSQIYETNLLSLEHFSIKNARAIRNYHHNKSDECSSIEFRSIIKNNSDIDRTIHISFHLKNNEGIVLEKDNGFKDIDANSGDMEPRVLVAFHDGVHYSCKDVANIDFHYYEKNAEKKKITLPILDANHR